MVKDMLRIAVAVLAELDASAEQDQVLAPSLRDKRKNTVTSRESSRAARVRNWGESEDVDWMFLAHAE